MPSGQRFSHQKLFLIRFLLIAGFIGNGIYLWWRMNPLFWNNSFLSILLLVAELVFFANMVIHLPVLWFRKPTPIPLSPPVGPIKIALVIPTYNESIKLLSNTLKHCLNLDIPPNIKLKVVVLDDGQRPWLKEFVSKEGRSGGRTKLEYVSRSIRNGFKAGNINHYLEEYCKEDWLLVLDADFVPRRDILSKFYPYLGTSSLGFVQAPQSFDNIPFTDPFGQDPDLWFSILEVGREGQDSLICCGTPTIFSVPALRKIHGMQLGVTEDFITGVTMQSYGYRSAYIHETIAIGKSSTDMADVTNKAERYASGAFEFVFERKKWRLGQKLSFWQKFIHFTYPLSFLAPLFTPILIMMPIISLMTGISPFVIDQSSRPYLVIQLLSLLSLEVIFFSLVGTKAWRAWQFYWGMFPASFTAVFRTLFGRAIFKVSEKGDSNQVSGLTQLRFVIWQLFFFLLGLVALAQSLLLFVRGELNISLYPAVGWLILNSALLSGVISPPFRKIVLEFKSITITKKVLIFAPLLATFFMIVYLGNVVRDKFVTPSDRIQDEEVVGNVSKNADRFAVSLDRVNAKLSKTGENNFQKLLFFIGWDENTEESGIAQFKSEVEPVLDLAYSRHMTPIITWEPKFTDSAKSLSLTDIVSGDSDRYLRGWRSELQKWFDTHKGYEVRIRFMHEMNAPIAEYPWSHLAPADYKAIHEHVYSEIGQVEGNLKWMLVFQNLTSDANWQNKRASDYEKYVPNIPFEYIGIDGYSRPFKKGIDGPPGGEVTPQQVLPEAFFRIMHEKFPKAQLVISETSVPYLSKTDEAVPYPTGKTSFKMTDTERSEWIKDLQQYTIKLGQKYGLSEVTWFDGNTDYHWSLIAPEDKLTIASFGKMISALQASGIAVGIYPGGK